MSETHERLDERMADLEDALKDVRDELQGGNRPRPRLRPPTPGEMLQMTREYAIPAAIATLEAQIKALELLRELLGSVQAGNRARAGTAQASDRVAEVGRATLEGVERALDRLEREMAAGGLPDDPEARDLLGEARDLRDEVDARLARMGQIDTETQDRTETAEGGDSVRIDVESELETIRDQVDTQEEDEDSGDGNGSSP
jgi:hypothetical protein